MHSLIAQLFPKDTIVRLFREYFIKKSFDPSTRMTFVVCRKTNYTMYHVTSAWIRKTNYSIYHVTSEQVRKKTTTNYTIYHVVSGSGYIVWIDNTIVVHGFYQTWLWITKGTTLPLLYLTTRNEAELRPDDE